MITCPSCGAEAGAADRFCAHCGSELTSDRVFTCPSCGAEAGATDKFCVNCGSGLIVYRSTKAARNWVYVGLSLYIVISYLAIRSLLQRIALLERIQNGEAVPLSQANSADNFVDVTQWAGALIALFTVLAYSFWIYRSNKNLRVLTAEPVKFSPRMAVWWSFVPVMNLFKPY